VLSLLMLAGRIGPIGLAAALALRQRNLLYTLPEERPIIG
jgi:trk system potassium uptake protein TrkH